MIACWQQASKNAPADSQLLRDAFTWVCFKFASPDGEAAGALAAVALPTHGAREVQVCTSTTRSAPVDTT